MKRNALLLVVAAFLILSAQASTAEPADDDGGPPVQILTREHDATEIVLAAAEREVDSIRRAGRVDRERLGEMLDFFVNFTDRCHHAKEERYLFPALRDAGPTAVALIEVAEAEHEMGRGATATLQALREHPDLLPAAETADRLEAFVQLMRDHIRMENEQLWPIADRHLSAEQKQELSTAFHVVETVELGEGFHEKYHAIAMDLKPEAQ